MVLRSAFGCRCPKGKFLLSKRASKIENSVGELRKEIASERDARQHLEERISHLEQKHLNPNMPNLEEDVVDKSMVVIGGFAADALEDAEKIVQDMLAGVDGFRDVDMAGSKQDIALASFDTPQKAMQFIRGQRTNPIMKSHNLWAAENRSRSERMRCKVVSKIKKFMIEIGGVEAKDIKVNYKLFKVNARAREGICWSPLSTGMVSFHGCMTMCRGLQSVKQWSLSWRKWNRDTMAHRMFTESLCVG